MARDASRHGVVFSRREALGLVLAAEVVVLRRDSGRRLRGDGDRCRELDEAFESLEK